MSHNTSDFTIGSRVEAVPVDRPVEVPVNETTTSVQATPTSPPTDLQGSESILAQGIHPSTISCTSSSTETPEPATSTPEISLGEDDDDDPLPSPAESDEEITLNEEGYDDRFESRGPPKKPVVGATSSQTPKPKPNPQRPGQPPKN
ncbi:hypothetical protein EW146_g9141 [Bondarzewia mesenterica]|uniref:Uncharacterized protein n=1 Tax=Bondarzewia mesenterica TaxID=1095465 RepID=A0A4S4L8W2_9AGAM|nr:hypothetical protein EW146_g9141 [Bondarzewia mesenterica]